MSIIELDSVSKTYPGGVQAVREVALDIERGELVGIVGTSGSGKSTLLNLIGTLDLPTAGGVRIDGHDVAALNDKEISALRASRIGFVFQQFHLAAGIRVLDNVADGALYTGMHHTQRCERAEAALERVGLSHRIDHKPHELSGGERQRVAVARAVLSDPPVILADEPTGNLDSASGAGVMDLLRDLNDSGSTVLVITHDHELAEELPRRIQLLDGRVVRDTREAEAAV